MLIYINLYIFFQFELLIIMSLLDVILTFQDYKPMVEYLISTEECKSPACLINLLKHQSNLRHSGSIYSQLEALVKKPRYTRFNFFESCAELWQEFHIHATQHLNLSEDHCLCHKQFASETIVFCNCGSSFGTFPVLRADCLPTILKLDASDSSIPPLFGSFFSYANEVEVCACLGNKVNYLQKSSETLILQIKYTGPIDILCLMSSIPSTIYPGDYFSDGLTENYYLTGYVLASTTGQISSYFLDPVLQRTTFIKFLREVIETPLLPIGLIYEQTSPGFVLELSYFTHAEALKIKKNPSEALFKIAGEMLIRETYAWTCERCGMQVMKRACSCGAERVDNYWVCLCGNAETAIKCKCGRTRAVCAGCKEEFDPFEQDCKRCGADFKIGEKCGVCGVDVGILCENCYNLLSACLVCGTLNKPQAIACKRCMNPSLELFKVG